MSRSNTSAITIPAENVTMARLVGMDEFEDQPTVTDAPTLVSRARTLIEIIREEEPERIIRAITYSCPCGDTCRACGEDNGTATADVDDWSVGIAGISYDRGIESNERIAAALESVDEHCREDLEWLLRHGPSDDVDSPAMQAVVARAESEPHAAVEPTGFMAVLRDMMLAAAEAVDPRKEERLRRLSITQLSGFTPVGGWQV